MNDGHSASYYYDIGNWFADEVRRSSGSVAWIESQIALWGEV